MAPVVSQGHLVNDGARQSVVANGAQNGYFLGGMRTCLFQPSRRQTQLLSFNTRIGPGC